MQARWFGNIFSLMLLIKVLHVHEIVKPYNPNLRINFKYMRNNFILDMQKITDQF